MPLFCHILSTALKFRNTLDYLLDPIFKLQRIIVREISFSQKHSPLQDNFFVNTNTFKKIVTYSVGLFMFKLNKGFLPKVISKQLLWNSDVHHYNRRQKNHLHASKGIHQFIYKTFTFQGIYIWNTILRNINTNISFCKFNHIIKSYINFITNNFNWHSW